MNPKLFDQVRLATDRFLASDGVGHGALGYIIEIYSDGACEVEFSSADGSTYALIVAQPEELEKVVPDTKTKKGDETKKGDGVNYAWGVEMSTQLHEYARRFAAGEVAAEVFADTFIELWKLERDPASNMNVRDSDKVSESLSTIFCLADLYNPEPDREEYEMDESQLRFEVRKALEM